MIERKWFPFTFVKADAGTGSFEGYASTWTVDLEGDIVLPGAFRATIPQFLDRGWISDAHQVDQPIGYPTDAREDARGLFIAGRFHGTVRAQTVRTFARERVMAGLEMGMSIGYRVAPGGSTMRSDGVRLLTNLDLVECALTIQPANVEALITSVKHVASDVLADPVLQRQRERFDRWYEQRELHAAKENVEALRRSLQAFR